MSRWVTPSRRGSGVAAGLTGTVLVHAAAGILLWSAVRPPAFPPPIYAVELVAAPAPLPEAKPAPEAIPPRPEPEAAPVKPVPKPPRTKPTPQPPAPTPAPSRIEAPPRAAARVEPLPGETPGTGRDAVTVSTPGLLFPYPEYLRNIVQEVYRRWDRPRGNAALRVEVSFLLLRDGSVGDIRVARTSGNFGFDLAAQGAVEAAGAARAFGPLPDGYAADVLPVSFYFTPRAQ